MAYLKLSTILSTIYPVAPVQPSPPLSMNRLILSIGKANDAGLTLAEMASDEPLSVLPKQAVAGSSPVSRSNRNQKTAHSPGCAVLFYAQCMTGVAGFDAC